MSLDTSPRLDAAERRHRRRALDRAARAVPEPAVVKAVSAHIGSRCVGTEAVSALPEQLSRVLSLPPPLTFRQNTTQAIRDIVQVTLLHHLDSSHAPPRAPGRLLCADVQHPAVREALRTAWAQGPESGLAAVRLADLLTGAPGAVGDFDAAVIGRYLSALARGPVSVVVIPHVVWFNGAVLDVDGISAALRAADPAIVIVVDGAQAVGHIPLAPTPAWSGGVDFYVGCGHKWLGGPETLGFARVSERILSRCERCGELLASGDVLGEVGGLSHRYRGRQYGTHPMGVAHGTMQALTALESRPGGLDGVIRDIHLRAARLRAGIARVRGARLLGPPPGAVSGVVAFSAPAGPLDRARDALDRQGYTPARYRLVALPGVGAADFIRLSPGPDLTMDEIDEVLSILNEQLATAPPPRIHP